MMKYMMIFMAFMFYKVPSGLGIYFITSSLWQIGERLLLPKVTHATTQPAAAGDGEEPAGRRPGRPWRRRRCAPPKPPGQARPVLGEDPREASKDPTYPQRHRRRPDKDRDDKDAPTATDGARSGKPPRDDAGKPRRAAERQTADLEARVRPDPRRGSTAMTRPCSTRPTRSRRWRARRGPGSAASSG